MTIAKQRVDCAVCAFGGTVSRRKHGHQKDHRQQKDEVGKKQTDKMSIFRTRKPEGASSSSKSKSQGGDGTEGKRSKKKQQQLTRSDSMARRERYERVLRQQYFEHGNRLSWDVQCNMTLTLSGARTFDDDELLRRSGSNLSDGGSRSSRKNRCKKCGQIKQGHSCPYYAASLQRSIGVMAYAAANAHVADEPGRLAPALCDMNNFIPIKSGATVGIEPTPDAPRKGRGSRKTDAIVVNGPAASPFRRKTLVGPMPVIACSNPNVQGKRLDVEDDSEHRRVGGGATPGAGDSQGQDLLFLPKMEITPDQYRAVTPKKHAASSKRDYAYPQVPLTFSQRKSMSDALFSLSKAAPKLTEECAMVLTEARKNDQWDLAVAELMVQVICVLYCSPSKDYTLEGLRRFLLTLGIVC